VWLEGTTVGAGALGSTGAMRGGRGSAFGWRLRQREKTTPQRGHSVPDAGAKPQAGQADEGAGGSPMAAQSPAAGALTAGTATRSSGAEGSTRARIAEGAALRLKRPG
jgi:hypothetical protein